MAEPSRKHVDDRLNAIRARCEAARAHMMAAARDADHIRSPALHADLMNVVENIDYASKLCDEKALLMQVAQDAWDADIDRERQAEERRERIALVDENYEARKVGRDQL